MRFPRAGLVVLTVLLVCGTARAAVPFRKADLFKIGRESAKAGDFRRAAAAFEDMARAEGTAFTLQLVVVCEAGTLAKLVDTPGADKDLYFLAAKVNGRDCFRAFWSVFPSAEAARAAQKSIPAGLVDEGKPPLAVALPSVLTVGVDAPRTVDESRAQVKTFGNASLGSPAAPAGEKVFTDKDLADYRKTREDDEKKYGVPKPLFEEPGLEKDKGKKGKSDAAPPPAKVEEAAAAPADDRSYWATLGSNARQAVSEKRESVNAAERDLETARTKLSQSVDGDSKKKLENEKKGAEERLDRARGELKAAEKALADLREKAIAKGAKAEWLQ